MANIKQASDLAARMRSRGKPDDQIRDSLRAWDLDDAAIDGVFAGLSAPTDPAAASAAFPSLPIAEPAELVAYATTLTQRMRSQGCDEDEIRDSLRCWDLPDPDVDALLAANPPPDTPVQHHLPDWEPTKPRPFSIWQFLSRRLPF